MPFLINNGSFVKDNKAVFTAANRSFRYGDGLFETMKILDGEIILNRLHFARMMEGLKLLQFEIPDHYTPEYFSSLIFDLCKKNKCSQTARVRLTVFRADGGLYAPANYFPNFIIQATPLAASVSQLNENGLVIDIFPDAIKAAGKFSSVKSNNCLPYVMGAIYAKQNNLDEIILCNQYGRMADTTIANLFIVKNKIAYTPPLSEGGINGVMRRYLLSADVPFPVREKIIGIEDLPDADEIFLTNALYGLRWVKQFRQKKYNNEVGAAIHQFIISSCV